MNLEKKSSKVRLSLVRRAAGSREPLVKPSTRGHTATFPVPQPAEKKPSIDLQPSNAFQPEVSAAETHLSPFRQLKRLSCRVPPWVRSLGFALSGAIFGLFLYAWFVPPPKPLTPRQVQRILETYLKERPPEPTVANVAYQKIARSLVLIRTQASKESSINTPQNRRESENPSPSPAPTPAPRANPFSNPPSGANPSPSPIPEEAAALGTGFIVDEMGTILTCFHVIAPGGRILITFFDGLEAEGEVIYAMPEQDLAVLKPSVVPDDVQPAVLAGSGNLRIGDEVVAVGNPFGILSSLTTGVVSGLGRSFYSQRTGQRMLNLIQFDAAVNPGNSGGPLLDRNGEVVGVVSALFNPTEQEVFIGIGFAVPLESAASALGIPPW